MKRIYISLLVLTAVSNVSAQVFTFADDQLKRGYYNRPYERYEAEPDYCMTNATFLPASDDQRDIQAEASNQQALRLSRQGDEVSWTVGKAGDGLTIRFSLPDAADGQGQKSTIAIFRGEQHLTDLTLDSYHAWQYTTRGATYPDNTQGDKMIRMRFDETHLLLPEKLHTGETLRLLKKEADGVDITIDFIELEPVPEPLRFEDIQAENKVEYTPDKGFVSSFVEANAGKTIFFPEGTYNISVRLYLKHSNTRLIGAGMWYSTIYFTASSDQRSTHSNRGIEANADNLLLDGFYINTCNNKRYYDNNPAYQVGKGLMGSWGTNSQIRNCWIEHFECGGWIANYSGGESRNLLIEHCRFRNNYADGINLCQGSTSHTVRYCSFRNNGDDDMASWSTGKECSGNTYEYCTAENNWRASSLGFFGGKQQTGRHLAIYDALESGVRVNSDFAGTGFSSEGEILIEDVTIRHCGCVSGTIGTAGDFWGNMQGALNLTATANYNMQNVRITGVDIVDSRSHAVLMKNANGKQMTQILLEDIYMKGADYGLFFVAMKGNAHYCNLHFEDMRKGQQNITRFTQFEWIDDCGTGVEDNACGAVSIRGGKSGISIQGGSGSRATVCDLSGRCHVNRVLLNEPDYISLLQGWYVVNVENRGIAKVRVE